MKYFRIAFSWAVCLTVLLGVRTSGMAQQCNLSFSPNPGTGVVDIELYYYINHSYTSPNNLAYFKDIVTTGNSTIPTGTYLGWCLDLSNSIDAGPELYDVLMYSTCDPNIDAELAALGAQYHFTYPITDQNLTPPQWSELNYLLNHKLPGASYWDIQATIWNIIGGPLPPNSVFDAEGYHGLVYDTNNVAAMTADAVANGTNWVPQCGDVIAVVIAAPMQDATGDFPVQLTCLELPYPCVPCISVTKEVACLQPTNSCGSFGKVASGYAGLGCGGSVDQPGFCYQITVSNCGTIPLTNLVVSDSLLGLVTTNFFTNSNQVFAPGAMVTAILSMSFPTNATNTVTVIGEADLTNTVTNMGVVITNGQPLSATDSAVALVDSASVSCSLSLSSPLAIGGTGSNVLVLPQANYYSSNAPVTLSIQVCNTGSSALQDVTINIPALSAFNCSAPPAFSLAPGQCQTFQLCIGSVTCPAQLSLDLTVNGQVVPDATHCGVYDMTSTNLVSVCSACTGTIYCTNCAANLSGTILEHCNAASSSTNGDMGIAGVTVVLLGSGATPLATTVSDLNGNYAFVGLASGTYYVQVVPPAGYVETYPAGDTTNELTVQITGCSGVANINFGYANTQPPLITVTPGGPLGCNPANLPTSATVVSNISATVSCGTGSVSTNITSTDTTNGCVISRTFTIVVTDTHGNSSTNNSLVYTWTVDTAAPVLSGVPPGTNYGCNPTAVQTLSNILAIVSASDTCSPATISASATTNLNGCLETQVITIVATNACGNMATAYVTNTWTVDTTAPVLSGIPAGTNYGCNPASVATISSILSGVSANDTCSPANVTATATTNINGCLVTEIFAITAVDGCGNAAQAFVTNTWTVDTTAPVLSGVPFGTNLGCNPASIPTVSNILSTVTASDTCSTPAVSATMTTNLSGCTVSQIFTITAVDGCGNTAVAYVTNTWSINSTGPVLSGLPAGTNYGCNPTSVASISNILAGVTVNDTCSVAKVSGSAITNTNGCLLTQIVTITAADACSNTAVAHVTNTWTADSTPPTLKGVPASTNLGCNPASIPTSASILALVSATDTCSPATVTVTGVTNLTGCSATATFTIMATNACGNKATATVNYTWTADTTALVIKGVPASTNLGCNPTSIPTAASIQALVSATDTCSPPTVTVTGVTNANGCSSTAIFTITAANACGNKAVAMVTNTWATPPIVYVTNITYITNFTKTTNIVITTNITITTNCCTNLLCGNFNSLNPDGGWLWCNSHISCYPGTNCVINCSAGSVTLNCTDGKTYNFPVPNCQITFSSSCTTASNWFDGTSWHTTLPCAGDDEIFCQGCPIPWQSDFANCKSVCWTTAFSCSKGGLNCNWQWGAACYNTSTPTCGQISPKACHNTPCQNGYYYSSSDHAGCPENYKPYCTGGGTGGGGANCTGSWSGTDTTCGFGTVTNISYLTNYVVVTNSSITTNKTVTTTELGPVLSGVPTGMNFGCNPTNVPTVASVQAAVTASQTCTVPTVTVTGVNTTNGCAVTQIFTIVAIDGCNNVTTASVTNTWTVSSGPVITCPADVTITNSSGGGGGQLTNYCTYTQGGWGADPHGCNAGSLLCNKFSTAYPCGYVQVGITNGGGYCLKFTSSSAIDTFLPCGGTASKLTCNATNASSCSAGVFAGEVLCLQLNCDFGKSGIAPCSQPFGGLTYHCSGSPFDGWTVSNILGVCNQALGGGSISNYGCSIGDLENLCNYFNQCFDGGCGSSCPTNLSCGSGTNVVIPPPSQTGTPTISDTCSSVTVTNIDTVTAGACKGSFVVSRLWIATDACGLTSTCVQTISINPCTTPPLVEGCAAGSAQVGVAYTSSVVVNGGVPPYTFAIASGALPPGLNLNVNTGTISGTPNTAGTYTYTLRVTDSLGNTATESGSCQICVTTTSSPPLTSGDTATIGFWNNKNGQGVINCFNGGPGSTNLGYALATTLPYLYGAPSGTNNLANKSNAYIAGLFQTYFSVTGPKVDAEMLAVALACYATSSPEGGSCGASFGFNITTYGTAIKTYNVKGNGTAIGLSNNTSYTILALLQQANLDKQNGTFAADAGVFNSIFDGINSSGDIH